jgi:hypothetical protein
MFEVTRLWRRGISLQIASLLLKDGVMQWIGREALNQSLPNVDIWSPKGLGTQTPPGRCRAVRPKNDRQGRSRLPSPNTEGVKRCARPNHPSPRYRFTDAKKDSVASFSESQASERTNLSVFDLLLAAQTRNGLSPHACNCCIRVAKSKLTFSPIRRSPSKSKFATSGTSIRRPLGGTPAKER